MSFKECCSLQKYINITKKNVLPDGESNPGHGGESAGS